MESGTCNFQKVTFSGRKWLALSWCPGGWSIDHTAGALAAVVEPETFQGMDALHRGQPAGGALHPAGWAAGREDGGSGTAECHAGSSGFTDTGDRNWGFSPATHS